MGAMACLASRASDETQFGRSGHPGKRSWLTTMSSLDLKPEQPLKTAETAIVKTTATMCDITKYFPSLSQQNDRFS
jgi:hypothetical protein